MRVFVKLALGVGLALFGLVTSAHHAAQAQFDVESQLSFVGKLTKVEMINPHPQLYFDVAGAEDPDGKDKTVAWRVEAPSVAILRRIGILRSLQVGEAYSIEFAPSRDGSPVALMIALTNPQGQRFGVNLGGVAY
ncbi:MAG: hypothetical protein ACI9UU_003153 [Candidatus Azotimanducaceae bacterium]|jgi:hypothetical protein